MLWLWPVWTWCEFDPIHQHVHCLSPMLLQEATMLATPQAFVRDPRWGRKVLMGGDGGGGVEVKEATQKCSRQAAAIADDQAGHLVPLLVLSFQPHTITGPFAGFRR